MSPSSFFYLQEFCLEWFMRHYKGLLLSLGISKNRDSIGHERPLIDSSPFKTDRDDDS